MINSFFLALSMFSKIPTPKTDFDRVNMKYVLCFFPSVGLIIGFLQCLVYTIMRNAGFGNIFISAVITVLPILVTGGIHMDGFMDTSDARHSYANAEKKLKILSDPHIGAFSVISAAVYFVIYFGAMCQAGPEAVFITAKCFILSRALSGLGAVTFKCAKSSGLLFSFVSGADAEFSKNVLMGVFAFVCLWLSIRDGFAGVACVVSALIVFWYYKYFSYKEFGGITGDLAGYFLQLCELVMVVVAVVLSNFN